MSIPRSRASLTRRLTGAESGLTTATTRPALTRLPKPLLISFLCSSEPSESQGLLQILDLLADLLDLRLHIHHEAGDIQILTLGTNGIGLTVQLLGQEIQLAAHGLV